MSSALIEHRAQAADTAAKLINAMDAKNLLVHSTSDEDNNVKLEGSSSFHESLRSINTGVKDAASIPKVSLGPVGVKKEQKTPIGCRNTSLAEPLNNATSLQKEMNTQERIIVTLQRDNEALLRDKKEIAARCKELEEKYEHLEAKHSLLLSAQQDMGSRSNLRVANDAAKIAQLQAHVSELQSALENERLKSTAVLHNSNSGVLLQGNLADGVAATNAQKTVGIKSTVPQPDEEGLVEKDHTARLREYERMHAIHKATIDRLHGAVEKLEGENRTLEEQHADYLRQIKELTARTRELESNVAQKKESIGELLRTCQHATANTQQLKKQETRILTLEAALAEKDEFAQKAMERLRAETKEVCQRYQETISSLEKRLDATSVDREVRQRVADLEKENADLRRAAQRASEAHRLGAAEKEDPAASSHTTLSETENRQSEGRLLEEALSKCKSERAHLETQLSAARAEAAKEKEQRATLAAELDNIHAEWDFRLQEMKRKFASQLQVVRAAHNDELDRLEVAHRSELLTVSAQSRGSENSDISAKLLRLVEKKGYDTTLVTICERLIYLEKRSAQKEEEMAYELSEVRRMAEVDKRILREKLELQLEHKNAQIKSFRLQLDELLSEIAVLQATT